MSGRVVTGALIATALGIGVLVGLAAPKSATSDDAKSEPDARQLQLEADLTTTQGWVSSLADAAVAHKVDGLRVALLVTDGTSDATVDQVKAALESGGATVAATAHLGDAWWNPSMASFRGELASQVSASVVGADGLGATDLLHHAILQAIVPGALPRGVTDPAAAAAGTGTDGTGTDAADGATRQEVLLEVLTRAEILTLDHPATDGVDALIIVTADGPDGEGAPEGAGAAMSATATVWEQYLGATEIVVAGTGEMGAGEKGKTTSPSESASAALSASASDVIAAAADTPEATRPSVVVISDPSLAAAQVVLALKEQSVGGTGTYGTGKGLELLAVP